MDDNAGLLSMSLKGPEPEESETMLSVATAPVDVDLDQLHKASAAVLAAYNHNPADAAVMLEQVAAAAAETGTKLDKATAAILEELKSTLTGSSRQAIKAAHDADQQQLDGHQVAFAFCTDKLDENLVKNHNEVELPFVDKKREEHITCRQKLKTLASQQEVVCNSLADWTRDLEADHTKPDLCKAPGFVASDLAAPDPATCETDPELPANVFRDWLAEKAEYFVNKKKEFQEKEDACIKARNAFKVEDCECDKLQRRFEQGFCEWRVSSYAICNEHEDCIKNAISAYVTTGGIVDNNEKMRVAEWKSIDRLICSIDVLLTDDDKAAKYDECQKKKYEYPFELKIHTIQAANNHCDISKVARHPCGSEFTMNEYEGMSDLAECVPCLGGIEEVATFAAVQIPQPETAPTCPSMAVEVSADAETFMEEALWACKGKPDGRHLIWVPDGLEPFWVHCADGWIVMSQRVSDSTDFNRNWADFADGFGDAQNFWLGQHHLHRLTTAGARLRVVLQSSDAAKPSAVFAEYDGFKIGNEDSKFKLQIGPQCEGSTVSDAMSYHNGKPFTTRDQWNDAHMKNCAATYLGAWWHHSCFNANLNMPYNDGIRGPKGGWADNPWGRDGHVKKAFMLLKPSAIAEYPTVTIDGKEYRQFWWWSKNASWPEGATDVFGQNYGDCSTDSPVCLSKLPADLKEQGAELLAIDTHGNQLLWHFNSGNSIAHAAWEAMHDGIPVFKKDGDAWNPRVLRQNDGKTSGTVQDTFMYADINGVRTLLLDDDGCDCESTLSMGMPSCSQEYAAENGFKYGGKEGDVGVDDFNSGCSAPSQQHSLHLFFRYDPVNVGLLAYYPMDGSCGGGKLGGGITGTGSHTIGGGNIESVSGVRGQALAFNSGYCYDNSFKLHHWGETMSVCAWMRRTGGEDQCQGIVSNGYYNHGSWELRYCGISTQLGGGVVTDISAGWDIEKIPMQQNSWIHACMTYDGSDVKYYTNGGLAATNSESDSGSLIDRDQPLYIGSVLRPGASPEHFQGEVDEVRIYDRALTEGDVQAIYSFDEAGSTP